MDRTVQEIYGHRVRVRVSGLCWNGSQLLLVNHHGLYTHDFWAPPGGGLEFGQSAAANLEREFMEETGLKIQVGEFQFASEFIQSPFHAVELFFTVICVDGNLRAGHDPETGQAKVISQVKYLSESEIAEIPEKHKHGLFRIAKSKEKIEALRGYLKI